jgi:predicted O-linked N-acetylglucosamine transferase (SPINDLY family)
MLAMAGIPELLQAALVRHQAGASAQAEQIGQEIVAAVPESAEAWHFLGFLAFHTGRLELAEDRLQRALGLNPGSAEAHNTLGGCFLQRGEAKRAAACFERAVELCPNFAAAHSNLGRALYAQQEVAPAIASFRRAIALNPAAPDWHNDLGNALADMAKAEEAAAAFRRAIELRPEFAEAHNNLGNVLWTQGKHAEALKSLRRAIALRPAFAEAWASLGNVLWKQGELDEAVRSFRQALSLRSDLAPAYSNLANVLKQRGEFEEAMACYRRALELQPDLHRVHSNWIYSLYFSPQYDAAKIHEEHRRWNERHAGRFAQVALPFSNDRTAERRLRIGYVSPDFCKHAQSLFTTPLFRAHDRRLCEIFCYADVSRPDSATVRLQGLADAWRNTAGLADDLVARMIRADQIDILVDLTMHMAGGRPLLFARRPAPIQVCWLAYPGTTGLGTMDYRLTDPYLDPPGLDDRHYTEKSVRLPETFWCYEPRPSDLAVNDLPAGKSRSITFGSLNNFCKINDEVLSVWADVLQAVPGSKLLILADQGSHRQRTCDFFARRGVAGDRVSFVSLRPRRQYLQLYHEIDIALDSFPANGHTTSLDAFWMGVPVVTLSGRTAIGRGGASILHNLGLPELISHTPAQFVAIAARLAQDRGALSDLRQSLRSRLERSPLMDADRFARGIEAAYRAMWRQWCAE